MRLFGTAETTRYGSYVGFAFYWAWVCLVFYSDALVPGVPDSGSVIEAVWLWATWAHMAALFLFTVLAHFIGDLILSRGPLRLLGVLGMAIGTLGIPAVLLLLGTSLYSTVLLVIASGTIGVSSAWHVLQWGALYAALPRKYVLGLSLLSMVLGLALYFIFIAFPEIVGAVTVLLLPLFSGATAAVCRLEIVDHKPSEEESQWRSTAGPALSMVVPVAALFVFALCGEMLRVFSISLSNATVDDMGLSYLAGGLTGLVALLMYCIVSSRAKRASGISFSLVRTTLLLMAVAFLVAPFISGYSLAFSYGVFGAGFWCFRAISWTLCFYIIDRFGSNPIRVIGVLDGAFALSVVISAQVNSGLAEIVKVGGAELTTVSLITVFVLMFIAMVVLNGKGIRAVLSDAGCTQAEETVSPRERQNFDEVALVVESLAAEKRLTPREAEIALLLARGRSLPFVQNELYISEGTAQTHARHIYKKLGIHSRQELIDLVEERLFP